METWEKKKKKKKKKSHALAPRGVGPCHCQGPG